MRYQAAVVIHQENSAFPHAGFLQTVNDGIQGNDRSQHARKIVVHVFQGHGHDEGRPVFRCQRQRIASKLDHLQLLRLHTGYESALQRSLYERILLGPEISL